MENTSPEALARQLLDQCLVGKPWSYQVLDLLLEQCASEAGTRALFQGLIEPLGDRFEPKLADYYIDIFSHVIARTLPGENADGLRARYQRVRTGDRFDASKPKRVYVLSRVTLGADIAVTSQCLSAAAQRFPEAEIYFVGNPRNFELFGGDSRFLLHSSPYARTGLLAERLAAGKALEQSLNLDSAVIIDPDSRLTQLGLLPIGDERNYCFFESRTAGCEGMDSLSHLTGAWLKKALGVSLTRPWVNAKCGAAIPYADITVSFGTGENPAKRVSEQFEIDVVRGLMAMGASVLIDEGGSPAESAQALAIAAKTGAATFRGSFSCFAEAIKASKLFVGYDSVGQHAAGALGVPLVVAFSGWVNQRMFARWQPAGEGPRHVIQVSPGLGSPLVESVLGAVRQFLAVPH